MHPVNNPRQVRELIDISPAISETSPVWPGDTAFSRVSTLDMNGNDVVSVSKFCTTPHVGAHADAPAHTRIDGASIGDVPLEPYLGEALVLDLTACEDAPGIADLEIALARIGGLSAPRLILRTYEHYPTQWDSNFFGVAAEMIHWFADRGGQLIGIDGASFDPMASKSMDAHHAANDRGMSILEGLCLDEVTEGRYELIALPLKFRNLDASPVRAVLRTLP